MNEPTEASHREQQQTIVELGLEVVALRRALQRMLEISRSALLRSAEEGKDGDDHAPKP